MVTKTFDCPLNLDESQRESCYWNADQKPGGECVYKRTWNRELNKFVPGLCLKCGRIVNEEQPHTTRDDGLEHIYCPE